MMVAVTSLGDLAPLLAVGGAVLLAVTAAVVLARGAEERDLESRVRAVLQPTIPSAKEGTSTLAHGLIAPFRTIGEALRDSALVSARDVEEFQIAVAAAGFNPRAAVPTFIGIKAVLMVALPLLALIFGLSSGYDAQRIALLLFFGIVGGIFGPNLFLAYLKRKYEEKLRQGLPDALDLLVVCAEAGLGIETALDRVARELEASNRALALSLLVLVQELRLLPDRRQALERFAQRTEFEGFRRLAGTLAQTLKYGTPLAQALRVLAGELRQERLLRIEEKAIRLPALLVIPLILFIMPAVFIALVGPSVLELGKGLFSGVQAP